MTRVFIAEDETSLAEELSSHLENLGYVVCGRAVTVEKAMELIEEAGPDLILMDIVLRGDGDAIEAAEAIHSRWGIPVVFITAHSDAERLERAKPVYPFGYLLKPFGEREVKIAVSVALYAAEADRRREAEEALRESEARFKLLYEQAPLGYQSLDGNGNFIEVNKAWLEKLGYSREEVIGKNFGDFLDPDYTEHFKVNFPRFKAIGEILGVEFEMVKKNGKRILTAFNGKISRDRDGNFKQTHCIFHDITARRQAEEELRFQSTLLNQIRDMVAATDMAGRIVYVNEAVCKALDMKREELIGRTFQPRSRDYSLGATRQEIIDATIKDGEWRGEFSNLTKDGGEIVMDCRTSLVRGENGEARGMVGIGTDVTELKRAELALQAKHTQLDALVRHSPSAIVILDAKADVALWNPAAETIFGWSESEAAGRPLPVGPSNESPTLGERLTNRTMSYVDLMEIRSARKNGSFVEVMLSASPIRDDKGDYAGVILIMTDVTAKKMAEAEREKLSAQLRQAQKMEAIGTLAGGIAHDFNNILAAMIGYTELTMMDLPQDSLLTSNLVNVLEAGKRAKELVRQILDFSRRGESSRKPFELGPLAKEALKLLRSTLPSTIEIRPEIEPSRMTIHGDPTQIHQVLINLCSNAAQAMHEKGGLLSVIVSRVELDPVSAGMLEIPPGVYSLLKVGDTGQGMDRDTMGHIFEPFFTTKKTGEGTGMGLAVVYGVIRSHGGAIRVYSEENKGSTFHVYLPLLSASGTVEEIDQSRALPGGTERILYIDDEPALAELAKSALQRLGYQVTSLTSSRAALELFADKPDDFDLVITDYVMPHPTGIDLAKSFSEIRANLPILLCTGFGYRLDGDSAAKAGIKKVLMKPLVLGEVARAIREVLDFRRGMGD